MEGSDVPWASVGEPDLKHMISMILYTAFASVRRGRHTESVCVLLVVVLVALELSRGSHRWQAMLK